MALSDVHKWKHWVKVNSCAPTTLCISAVNTCDFPVVFYPICFKFLSYVAGVEIKIEKSNRNQKLKFQIELPISKLPSLGQQDKKCLKGSQKCVFFPVKLVVNQLYLNAWTSWIKSNETIALCGCTLLFVPTVIPNLNWQNLKRNCCSSNFFKSNAVNTWWKSQVNFSWHENSHHFYDFYKWP